MEDLHVRGNILDLRFPLYCYSENQNLRKGVTEVLLTLPTILIQFAYNSVHSKCSETLQVSHKTANCNIYFPYARKYICICTVHVHILNWIVFAMRSAHLQVYPKTLLHSKSKEVLGKLCTLRHGIHHSQSFYSSLTPRYLQKQSHCSVKFSAALKYNVVIFLTFCLLDLCSTV